MAPIRCLNEKKSSKQKLAMRAKSMARFVQKKAFLGSRSHNWGEVWQASQCKLFFFRYERKLADADKNVDSELIRDLRKRRKNCKKSFFFSFDIIFLGDSAGRK